jgi:hypothetical protein
MQTGLPANRLPFWSRVAFAAALIGLGVVILFALGSLLFIPGASTGKISEGHESRVLDAVWCAIIALPMLANAVAFVLAVTCLLKRLPGTPWLVLVISGLSVGYSCAVAVWAWQGILF